MNRLMTYEQWLELFKRQLRKYIKHKLAQVFYGISMFMILTVPPLAMNKGEDSVVLEFGDNNMKLDVTENCMCDEYEMIVTYNETTITINWEEDYI